RVMRDFSLEKPIDESAFRIVAGLYADYATPLNVRSERNEDARDWRHQTTTMDGADGEPMPVHIYLPNSAAPPFQTVVYFPGGDASLLRSSRDLNLTAVDFVIRSGRALIFPVYASTYERTKTPGIIAERQISITRVKEVRRVIDYASPPKGPRLQRLPLH